MKIGQFAKKHNISIDTIRHYIDLGLLLPLKNGAHYEFDEAASIELEDILVFKEMGFTLNEIKSIFTFKRFGKLTNYQAAEYYKQFFVNKHKDITQQIDKLNYTKKQLTSHIKVLYQKEEMPMKIGINLSALNLFVCPICKSPLTLSSGNIVDSQIVDGNLHCRCGCNYPIVDGIFMGDSIKHDTKIDDDFLVDYVKETPAEFLDSLYKNIIWFDQFQDNAFFQNKVVLDLGVGLGFSLRHIYQDLSNTTLYFAVDYDINKLKLLKHLLEQSCIMKNIIFICCDFLDIPIKDHCVDITYDVTGSSNYFFEHDEFLLNKLTHLYKENSYLLGNYIVFKTFNQHNTIAKEFRQYFNESLIRNAIQKLNFNILNENKSDIRTYGGKYETYLQEGDKAYGYSLVAKLLPSNNFLF